jgi:predicted regulator of Ras-like GTPase activity (Roadblock/LC7/MglB family)
VGRVDAAEALADLTEISAQIEAAVVASPDGVVGAATVPETAAAALARAGSGLLREAGERAVGVEARTSEASVFAVRDGAHLVAAVAAAGAASGLVLYDLRTCLRRLGEQPEKPRRKRAPRAKAKKTDDAA